MAKKTADFNYFKLPPLDTKNLANTPSVEEKSDPVLRLGMGLQLDDLLRDCQ